MSSYGIERIIVDLQHLDYTIDVFRNVSNIDYVVIRNFHISLGQFKDRSIDLAIPIPKDYPRTIGSSIHIKSEPILLDYNDTVSGKRNIIKSPLGEDWRYWSFRFQINPVNPTKDLISQINGIFKNI